MEEGKYPVGILYFCSFILPPIGLIILPFPPQRWDEEIVD
jgi:hypothetical protein